MLAIGTRVRATDQVNSFTALTKGMEGIVVHVASPGSPFPYQVLWDEPINEHDIHSSWEIEQLTLDEVMDKDGDKPNG